jgi:hypothetical protein
VLLRILWLTGRDRQPEGDDGPEHLFGGRAAQLSQPGQVCRGDCSATQMLFRHLLDPMRPPLDCRWRAQALSTLLKR